MDVGSSFGADSKSSEAFEPGEGAFDLPADLAQAKSVGDATAGDDRDGAAGADQAPVFVVVVAAVGVDQRGQRHCLPTTPRIGGMASSSGISDVVAVAAGEGDASEMPVWRQ